MRTRTRALVALLWTATLWAAVVGVGLLLRGRLHAVEDFEDSLSRDVADDRSAALDTATALWSRLGSPALLLGVGALAVVVIRWRTLEWRVAVIHALALGLQALVVLTAGVVLRRSGPAVTRLDPAATTSSYPGSQAAAGTALCVSVALVAAFHVRHRWLRAVAITVALAIPVLVAFAGVYRGTHHLSDVTMGAATGLGCAALAWRSARPADIGAGT
ncbi:MAG TPA: phosphatase PAP2 family protein [Candidatus Lustribacter sp.]|nr:phosphatase PAP2 family protein [Candidatus Lustribacter sp.]